MMITSGLIFYNLSVLLNAFVEERGFPVALTSAATAAFFASGGIAGIIVGRLTDRFDPRDYCQRDGNRRDLFVLGRLSIRNLASLPVSYPVWLCVRRHRASAAHHLGDTLVQRQAFAGAFDRLHRAFARRNYGYAFCCAFDRAGRVLHGATGPWMAAVLLLGVVPITLLVVRSSPAALGLEPDGGTNASSETEFSGPSIQLCGSAQKPLLPGGFDFLFISVRCAGCRSRIHTGLPICGMHQTAALALAVVASASIAGRLGGGWILLRMRFRNFALHLMAVQGVGLLLLAFAQGRIAILAAVALFGVTIGNSLMMHPLLLVEKYGTREYGRIFSVSQFIVMAGVAIGPFIAGAAYDWSGSYPNSVCCCRSFVFSRSCHLAVRFKALKRAVVMRF